MVSGTEEHNVVPAQPVTEAQAVPGASANDEQDSTAHASKAVEMNDLQTTPGATSTAPAAESSTQPATQRNASIDRPTSSNPPDLNRSQTAELALGPDGEPSPLTDPSTPALRITLMLTTGARHAYTISQKYLTSRKVTAVDASGNFDPREMSGYKLKELIWTDWRSEWEDRPRDPSSIRLIIMGRMIDDKVNLKGMNFPNLLHITPRTSTNVDFSSLDLPFALQNANVVHMTVKPADLLEDEAEGAGKTGSKGSIRANNSGEEGGAGCRCVIL
ncbi:hypothetical protein Q7P35_011292 [Cladosporium inversicolor]